MNTLRLVDPWWLLLALPLLVVTVVAVRRDRRASVLYSSALLLRQLPMTLSQRIKRLLPWLRFLGLLLVLVALARPQAGLSQFRIRTEGIAIIMCLDRSGSMEALDFEVNGERVNRLAVVKQVFREFVVGKGKLRGRPDDLIGLVTFGGFAEGLVPLTLDHGALLEVLDSVQIPQPVYGSQGKPVNERFLQEERATAIGDAVTLSVDRLKECSAKSKVIILLSDGENTAGVIDPTSAGETAKEFGVKVYSIGIGTTGRVPFPVMDPFGRRAFVSQMVHLDETTLKMLAEVTGGRYFNAQDTEALSNVYAAIDQLEKSVSEGNVYSEYRELYHWWLLSGLALILTEAVLRHTRFRAWP
jgi:Ca-activated chloride channel family protein